MEHTIEIYGMLEASGTARVNVDVLSDGRVADCWREEAYNASALAKRAAEAVAQFKKLYAIPARLIINHGQVIERKYHELAQR